MSESRWGWETPVVLIVACLTVAGCGEGSRPHGSGAGQEPSTAAAPAPSAPRPSAPPATPPTKSVAPATAPAPAAIVGRIPTLLPTTRHLVALTFDAGAGNGGVSKILDTLAKTRVPATFFMTGRFAELFPADARRIASAYPIGNHTYDHQDLLKLDPAAVTAEIRKAETEIDHVAGQPPLRLFRFPYGSSDAATLRIVNNLGYTAVGWTVDSLGWEGTSGGQSVDSVVGNVLARLQPGEIVLMHVGANPTDGTTLDADALATIIKRIRARGYGFTRLADRLHGS